jgi:hypothetical protein
MWKGLQPSVLFGALQLNWFPMSQRLQGKVGIVTGAGTGNWARMRNRFGQRGARVVLAGRRKDRIEQVAAAIGDLAYAIPVDVSESGAQRMDRSGFTVIPGLVGMHNHLYYTDSYSVQVVDGRLVNRIVHCRNPLHRAPTLSGDCRPTPRSPRSRAPPTDSAARPPSSGTFRGKAHLDY